MFLIIGILFASVGLLMLLKPHWIYELVEEWKNNVAGDPSDSYLFSTRFGGSIVVIIGIISIIAYFYCK